VETSPLLAIEVIMEGDDLGITWSVVVEPLVDVIPVFPSDMNVVMFVAGARAGKLGGAFSLCKMF
jgi:hypothetical protein